MDAGTEPDETEPPEIWTATRPHGPSRRTCVLLGVGFLAVFGLGLWAAFAR